MLHAIRRSSAPATRAPTAESSAPPADPELWDACVQFEGMLIGQMLRQMRPSPSTRGILPAGIAQQAFWGQYCAAVGEDAARATPLGIAHLMFKSTQAQAEGGDRPCRLAESA